MLPRALRCPRVLFLLVVLPNVGPDRFLSYIRDPFLEECCIILGLLRPNFGQPACTPTIVQEVYAKNESNQVQKEAHHRRRVEKLTTLEYLFILRAK